jgi:multisubunit Na+/H+ antiporter MnhB subunit
MSTVEPFDALLAVAVLLAAALALSLRRRVAVVTTFLVLGVLLAAVWARLGAPDVALAEAVIASGVTGALLIATITQVGEGAAAPRRPVVTTVAGVVAGLAAVLALGRALLASPGDVGPDHLGVVAQRVVVEEAVVGHPVTAVLLELRAYDTLLEVAVLAAAALVAVTLAGSVPSPPEPDRAVRPALSAFVDLAAPVVVLVAGWLLVAGTTRPGGAFQAGAMLAGLLVLLHVTGRRVRLPGGWWLRALVVVGLLCFVGVGAVTAVATGRWLALQGGGAGTVILALEAVLAVGIGVALAVLVLSGGRGSESTASETETETADAGGAR